jgi:hypothetical protein
MIRKIHKLVDSVNYRTPALPLRLREVGKLSAIRDMKLQVKRMRSEILKTTRSKERDPRSEKLKISGVSHHSLTVYHAYPITTDRLYHSTTQICRREVSKPWYLRC